jgi:3-methyladenine DNA glycosylase AlkC
MVSKVADVQDIVDTGVVNPRKAFPNIKALAKSDDWVQREVSATALVEISKKQPEKVVTEMLTWSKDRNTQTQTGLSKMVCGS